MYTARGAGEGSEFFGQDFLKVLVKGAVKY